MSTLPLAMILACTVGQTVAEPPPKPMDFSREVRPILSNYCFPCHGPDDAARKGKLRLDDRDSVIKLLKGDNRAIVSGHPDESELFIRVTSPDEKQVMPPVKFSKKPTAREIEILRRWIEQGAAYTKHWAYVPPVRSPLPTVADKKWAINSIDRFILARLEKEGLKPSPPADRYTLIRRASIDLTGLPPTPEEADRFVNDTRPDAYERAIDALLAQPTYGERWAAMWLDLARYADSAGYLHDPSRSIWRWRDWLIHALNDNVPYDRLTIEMLAGDLLSNPTLEQIIATGFHRNSTTNTEGGSNAEEYHHAAVVDRVNTTMQVWMGSTFGCAQCHNHKFDPFSQKDYYRLFAIFNNTADFNSEEPSIKVPRIGQDQEFATVQAQLAELKKQLEEETRQIDEKLLEWEKTVDRKMLPKDVVEAIAAPSEKRTPAQTATIIAKHRSTSTRWTALEGDVKKHEATLEQVSAMTLIFKEIKPRETYISIRGEFQNHGERVTPGIPGALHPAPKETKMDRLGLAKWLVDPANPLVARVAVNRLWQEIFGIGIVESSEEFGMQGEPPSHPELLDWLATEYVRTSWDTKQILKLIVMSAAYRQSSRASEELSKHDPANRLLARGPRIRLAAEALRDQALAVSGLLSPKLYGPPVHPHQATNGLAAAFGSSTDWETSKGEDCHRRALYTRLRRNLPYPSMVAFDLPDRAVCSMRRIRTNTPLQALVTLNDPVFIEAAQALARRMLSEGGTTPESRVKHGIRLALTRPATDEEVRRLVKLYMDSRIPLVADNARATALATKMIGPLPKGMEAADAAAWTVVSNILLNLDEFLMKR